MTDDPTKLRNQPSLTTSSGLVWLIVGGLFAAIAVPLLLFMTALPLGGIALAGAIIVSALYLGMIAAHVMVPPGRRRLGLMAAALIGIAAVSLIAVLIVAFASGSGP